MYDKILVATDGSENAREALELAIATAETQDSEIHIVNVVDKRSDEFEGVNATAMDQLEKASADIVEEEQDYAESQGVKVEADVLHGVPHRKIDEYVEEHDIDAVFVGTTGRSGLDNVMLGSTADKILRTASVPVTVV